MPAHTRSLWQQLADLRSLLLLCLMSRWRLQIAPDQKVHFISFVIIVGETCRQNVVALVRSHRSPACCQPLDTWRLLRQSCFCMYISLLQAANCSSVLQLNTELSLWACGCVMPDNVGPVFSSLVLDSFWLHGLLMWTTASTGPGMLNPPKFDPPLQITAIILPSNLWVKYTYVFNYALACPISSLVFASYDHHQRSREACLHDVGRSVAVGLLCCVWV